METLRRALTEAGQPIAGRILTVRTNGKGDGSKGSEEMKVQIKNVVCRQPRNPNIVVVEFGSGKVKSLGANTEVTIS